MNWANKPFIDYLNAVDDLLSARYGITSLDAGLVQVANAQEDGWSPEEYVARFGEHYHLDRIDIST